WGLLGLAAGAWLVPSAETLRVQHRAALKLRGYELPGQTLVLHEFREPSLIFYLGKPATIVTDRGKLLGIVHDRGPVFTLLREQEIAKLMQYPSLKLDVCERIEGWQISRDKSNCVAVARLSLTSGQQITTGASDYDARR